MWLNRHELMVSCALLVGCGDQTNGHEDSAGMIDTLGGSTGTGGDTDGGGIDDDLPQGYDLGPAGDSAGPGPDECEAEPPPAVMLPTDPTCKTEPQIGMFTPVVEWTKNTWTQNSSSTQSVTTPLVVQLSDDNLDGSIDELDTPDIAYVTYDNGGMLRAVSGDGGAEVLSVPVAGFNRTTGIAAADIDGDAIVEIIGVDSSGRVLAFEHDGTMKWMSEGLGGHVATHDNSPAISDMDGDGVPEIVVGRAILDADGNVIGAGSHGTGSFGANGSLSFAVDVDGDAQQEVVVGNALYRIDGSAIWHNGHSDGFPAVGDFDMDGTPEIVVVSSGQVRLQSSVDGTVLWTAPIPGGQGGPPTVADFDGDSIPEIGVAGSNSYTVFEGDGSQRWTNVTQDYSSGITGSSVYDFEGDGVADVVYADETTLWVYAGHDGTVKLAHQEHSSGTRIEYPIIADVDGDGEVEIAYVSENYLKDYRGLTVIGDANHSWRPGRAIWNQHAYHITNVTDGGEVPVAAAQNWKTYNNFRSGDLSPNDGLSVPAVQLDVFDPCEASCDDDGLRTVFVQLGNPGAAELTAGADIEVYGLTGPDEVLIEVIPYDQPLPEGQSTEGIPIQIDPAQYEAVRFRAVAHELLCDDQDAQAELLVEPCPDPIPPQG